MIRLIILFFFFLALGLSGQEMAMKEKTFGISMVPQYAFSNGTRIDFDVRLSEKGHWLVVGPQLYISNGTSGIWNYDRLTGTGIDLQHRIFLRHKPEPTGTYLAYGPVIQFFSVRDQGLEAYGFKEGDDNYIGLNEKMIRTNIFKLGGNLIFGYQTVLSETLYLDFFLGTGIRFSYDNRKSGLHSYYNKSWVDLGYSGTLMVGGFRFGLMF
jgi:hypothetical protein